MSRVLVTTDCLPAAVARSWLLVPAGRDDDVAAAEASAADAVVLDLEDGVADRNRAAARCTVARRLQMQQPVWVRISDVTTGDWALDLDMLATAPPGAVAGVVLAKAETGEHIEVTAARLPRDVPVVALIETAIGLANVREVARSPATLRLAFGSGDFCRDTGISADPLSLAYPRSQLVIASRVERIAPPIDGPTTTRDDEVLLSATATGRAAGMTGKLCLHPDQTEQINAALSPSTDEVAWAHAVITRLGEDGAHVQQSSDRPMLKRALHILEQALTFRR